MTDSFSKRIPSVIKKRAEKYYAAKYKQLQTIIDDIEARREALSLIFEQIHHEKLSLEQKKRLVDELEAQIAPKMESQQELQNQLEGLVKIQRQLTHKYEMFEIELSSLENQMAGDYFDGEDDTLTEVDKNDLVKAKESIDKLKKRISKLLEDL